MSYQKQNQSCANSAADGGRTTTRLNEDNFAKIIEVLSNDVKRKVALIEKLKAVRS